MLKKFLVLIACLSGLLVLAAGCWLVGLWIRWPLWKSASLFAGILVGLCLLRWLHRRWRTWRLRRQLSRPVNGDAFSTRRLDTDWRAGLNALKRSRLSRFGSPLYVLPWYLALGPEESRTTSLLRRVAGTEPIEGQGEDPAVLRWWLLRHGVVLSPSTALDTQDSSPPMADAYWRRLLYWMMHTRRREPLNGLILVFDVDWLTHSDDNHLRSKGQQLRTQLDDLARIYNARIPVYIVLVGGESLEGFTSWAQGLGNDVNRQAMGYLNKIPHATVGQFIGDAFNSIVHRMFDLRVLNGVEETPDASAFGLPERMTPLADRLGIVLLPAFQATPYAETPLLRGLYLTGRPLNHDHQEPPWFSEGLFDHALPVQRHAWQPLERWRHWRRLMRHAIVVSWLLLCVGISALLLYASRVAQQQLQVLNQPSLNIARDFSGPVSADLYVLQNLRTAIHSLQDPTPWTQRWLPFHRRIEQARQALINNYAQDFHQEIVVANLNPLLLTSLPLAENTKNDQLLAAWVQMLVRRINLIDTALRGQNVYAQPAFGSEIPLLFSQEKGLRPSLVDGAILGSMYQDYLTWQPDRQMLISERQALAQALMNLNLGARPLTWINDWVDLQGNIPPVRLTDFWNIQARPDEPYVPAAFTPAGEQAVASFVKELEHATNNNVLWQQRHEELRTQHIQTGLNIWYEFSDAFISVPQRLADGTVRRAVLSSLFTTNDPYGRLMHLLAQTAHSIPEPSRPRWMSQAIQADGLRTLIQNNGASAKNMASKLEQHVGVIQQFGGDLLQHLPNAETLRSGFAELHGDQQAVALLTSYRQGVLDTITPLQQGQGTAMKAAGEIWSFGHDPSLTSVALIDANSALGELRKHITPTDDSRSNVVWKLLSGPMDFTLDYAGRSVACTLQEGWDSSVLSVARDAQSADLADSLLFGDRGQVSAFLNGDVKRFVDQTGNRYQGRRALGQTIPLNGQFYAFASMAQLRQITLAGDTLQSKRNQSEMIALNQQQTELSQQIAKLEATTANVMLSTVPPQTNPDAKQLPESITLTLQCANNRLTLENLNFPNQNVFPWSLANCGDTMLTIRFANFTLTRLWSGARGFIDFLREFSSGQRRYTTDEFRDQAAALQQAGVQWVIVSYRQQGQDTLLRAFADADKLYAQSNEVKARLAHLQPGSAPGTFVPLPPPTPQVPQRIISNCMGPENLSLPSQDPAMPSSQPSSLSSSTLPRATPTPSTSRQRLKPASAHPESRQRLYDVQVGIFADPSKVRAQLQHNGYRITESTITLRERQYQQIRVEGYHTLDAAKQAAHDIGGLLQLTPEILLRPVTAAK